MHHIAAHVRLLDSFLAFQTKRLRALRNVVVPKAPAQEYTTHDPCAPSHKTTLYRVHT